MIIRKTDIVITVCESISDVIQREYSISDISVVRNMPEITTTNYKDSRGTLHFPKCKYIIIYTGVIIPGRGMKNIIQAMKNVNDNIGLVIMGNNSSYKTEMIEHVESCNLNDRISFVDAVQPDKVISVCRLASAGIISSRNICTSYYLCLPNKLFEYIQSGLPVLCSDFPEMNKIIQQYQVGLTFNPDNPNHIAEKINKIFNNKAKYYEYCNASNQASKILNWDKEQANLFSVYRQL